jgi:hypothetical protein
MELLSKPIVTDEAALAVYDQTLKALKDASANDAAMHTTDFGGDLTDPDDLDKDVYKPSFGYSVWVLLLRSWRNANRNFILLQFKIFVCCLFVFFCCSTYAGSVGGEGPNEA